MFTGLVEKIGTVSSSRKLASGMVLRIDVGSLSEEISLGDSVCVDGACLTATAISASLIDFDISPETASVSTLSSLRQGSKVNLELALKAAGRFGGHIVQGHIDGMGKIKSIVNKGSFYELTVYAPPSIMDMMIAKGSVCLSGISLTIASLAQDSFTAAVIPVTWKETTLQYLRAGDSMNIEADLIVKTIKARIDSILNTKGSNTLTAAKLKELGF